LSTAFVWLRWTYGPFPAPTLECALSAVRRSAPNSRPSNAPKALETFVGGLSLCGMLLASLLVGAHHCDGEHGPPLFGGGAHHHAHHHGHGSHHHHHHHHHAEPGTIPPASEPPDPGGDLPSHRDPCTLCRLAAERILSPIAEPAELCLAVRITVLETPRHLLVRGVGPRRLPPARAPPSALARV